MTEFKRQISYLYEYEGKVKGKNVGFVKLETRNGLCKLNVSIRKLYLGSGNLGVYLLSTSREIFLGNLVLRNGGGEFRTTVQAADIEQSGQSIDDCYGLTIHEKKDSWKVYTTIWEDSMAHAAELASNKSKEGAAERKTPITAKDGRAKAIAEVALMQAAEVMLAPAKERIFAPANFRSENTAKNGLQDKKENIGNAKEGGRAEREESVMNTALTGNPESIINIETAKRDRSAESEEKAENRKDRENVENRKNAENKENVSNTDNRELYENTVFAVNAETNKSHMAGNAAGNIVFDQNAEWNENIVNAKNIYTADTYDGNEITEGAQEEGSRETIKEREEVGAGRGGEASAERGGEVSAEREGEASAGRGGEVSTERGGEASAGRGGEVSAEKSGEGGEREGYEEITKDGREGAMKDREESMTKDDEEKYTREKMTETMNLANRPQQNTGNRFPRNRMNNCGMYSRRSMGLSRENQLQESSQMESQKLSNQQSVNRQPLNQAPINRQPLNQASINRQPLNQAPVNRQPSGQAPVNRQPFNQSPANSRSYSKQPVNNQPFVQPSVNHQPFSQPPVNGQPNNQPPVNGQPYSQSPVNGQLHSQPPVNSQPYNQPPVNGQPFNQRAMHHQSMNQQPINQQQRLNNQQPLTPSLFNQQPTNQLPLNQQPFIRQQPEEPLIVGDPEALAKLEDEEKIPPVPLWDFLSKTYPKIQAFESQYGCEILVIKPQDIGLLPREIWIYGNNSFLLHGYYNYRYLILARLENPQGNPRYLLGVPGHYYNNEKYMASMFGFPNFVLSKKQQAQDGRFGYWYTDIRLGEQNVALAAVRRAQTH